MKKQIIFGLITILIYTVSCRSSEVVIPTDSLPDAIKNYIATNYGGYTIDEAQRDTLCNGMTGIEVELEKRGAAEIALFFNTENAFIQKEEEINYRDLPSSVKAFISTNFNNYNTDDEADKITLANGTIQYEVELKEKTTKVEKDVVINSDGTLKICER